MRIVNVDPRTDPLWEKLLDQNASSVFSSPAWLRVLSDTYDWQAHALVLLDTTGAPRAGIPFCRIADLMGERIVTLPFSDYCDPIVADFHCWQELVDELVLDGCPIVARCLHNDIPLADERFALVKRAKWHGLDLGQDLDAICRALDESTRRAIRKSERDGLSIHLAERPEELRTFFEMHLGIRKYKYRLLAQPFRFFESIWREFVETRNGCLMLATHEGRVVAGVMFLAWKGTLYYKFNASVPANLPHRPNDRLMWEGIKYGQANGCTSLDFGLSDWDQDGLIRYKRKFATSEKTISFLRYPAGACQAQHESAVRAALSGLTELFVDHAVPDHVSERAGRDLYRYFT